MGKRRYKLGLKIAAEQADIAKAAKKRGLWSTIGSTLGAALAIAVTGGAAAPLVAGAIAAGASYAGGHLGNYAAGKSGGKLKGKGRFFSAERASLAQGVKDKIGQTAVKTGLQVACISRTTVRSWRGSRKGCRSWDRNCQGKSLGYYV